jgi:hypothetical protein
MPHSSLIARSIISKGFSKVKFKMGIIQRILLLLPFPLALWFGIHYFAIGLVLAHFLILIVYTIFAAKYLKISFKDLWYNIVKPFIPFICCILLLDIYLCYLSISALIDAMIFTTIQILVLIIIKHPLISFVMNIISRILEKIRLHK